MSDVLSAVEERMGQPTAKGLAHAVSAAIREYDDAKERMMKKWKLSDNQAEAMLKMVKLDSMRLVSEVTPEILSVLFADPDRMSAYDLLAYTKHLEANNQRTDRYEIAFWKKIVYPLSIFVMMALALPFAYLHFRAGGVSLKIFAGIMIGVCFQLINSLFSHLGLLNTWPAFVTAALPSLLFMVLAVGALWWVERT